MPDDLNCFTDGGCLTPACPASWGVILAGPQMENFWLISSGLVPGWIQTALRGEIWAVISAGTLALATCKKVSIWTDNDLVFERVKQFRHKERVIKPNQKHADPWSKLQQVVQPLGPQLVAITKVASH